MQTLSLCRQDFPSLHRMYRGRPLVYLDGPGGTQVPQPVIDAISQYYQTSNANTHGQFITSQETDALMQHVRTGVADFLGAEGPESISFGQNMTTLCFSLSQALARTFSPGDEIVITELDHEANRGPWLALKEQGLVVKEVKMTAPGVLDYDDFRRKVTDKTKVVAVGYASNLTGTVNDLATARKLTSNVGAYLVIDAVHYAPHFSLDVQRIDCDFLLCSAYKFYGPHVGILYSKPGLLDQLPTNRLVTQEQQAPYLIETGTLNHAAIAGVGAAIRYLASFGQGASLREQLIDAFARISEHERARGQQLYEGLSSLEGVEIKGLDFTSGPRTPTLSFFKEGITAEEICAQLGKRSVIGWDGHFYAWKAVEAMGLLDKGGVTRLGVSLYTTEEEIDYTLAMLRTI